MLILWLVAFGVALRPERWWQAMALAAPVVLPWWAVVAGVGVGVWAVVHKSRPDPYQEVAYLQAVSSDLRAGRSLRQALIDAAPGSPNLNLGHVVRLCRSGRPMTEVAKAAPAALPGTGVLVGAAVRIAAASGGRVADAFSALAGIQADRIELKREVRAASSAARASVIVLTVLPLAGLGITAATGMLADLMAMGRVGAVLVGVGVTLLVLGASLTLMLGRRIA